MSLILLFLCLTATLGATSWDQAVASGVKTALREKMADARTETGSTSGSATAATAATDVYEALYELYLRDALVSLTRLVIAVGVVLFVSVVLPIWLIVYHVLSFVRLGEKLRKTK
jgi:hypothetical protein